MPEPEQQQQAQRGVAMPEVSTNRLSADDYVYEVKPRKEEAAPEAQAQQSGGMSSQFEIVSNPLDRNV